MEVGLYYNYGGLIGLVLIMLFADCIFHRRMVFLPLMVMNSMQIILELVNLVFYLVIQRHASVNK